MANQSAKTRLRGCRDACVKVNNTICYVCVHDEACHKRRRSCKRQGKETSKRTWWGGKAARPKRRRKVIEYEYEYDYGGADRGCTCGDEHPDSEDESAEEPEMRRVVRRATKVKTRDRTQKPREQTKKTDAQGRTRWRSAPKPVQVGDESDDSLRCQVSFEDSGAGCEEESLAQGFEDALKDVVGRSRTLSKEDSDELGERAKDSHSSRELGKPSRHSV